MTDDSPTLGAVVDLLHEWYPPSTADSWDKVGLVSGDPDREVARVMFAVDPTLEVAREAVERGADLLVVHHPLFLTPVSSVAATTPKGRVLHTLASGDCALLTAHTNADQAEGGVSESLALALGLEDLQPILPAPGPVLDKVVTFVPHAHAESVRAAMTAAGAGQLGDYDSCTWSTTGEGRFRPLDGADPTIGSVGRLEVVPETRVEAVVARSRRAAVVRALLDAHPYEEPAFDVIELADPGTAATGSGRLGQVEETTLADFADRVARALPPTAHGVRVAGDPQRSVRKVAVCGGAGDFLLDRMAGADVDVYLTSDLRHHRASEFIEHGGPALVDVAHWAAEWTWLPAVRRRLDAALAERGWGDRVGTHVSTLCTDPWNFRPEESR
jgi:dinuclear metal center YbgI/SA1388 family protein